jgi:glycosyltransferase involved in cell wall biosynthesis
MKKKVLIIQSYIAHYRVAFFEGLASRYNLEIFTSDKNDIKYDNLNVKFFRKVNFFFGFYYKDVLKAIKKNNYEAVILEANPRIFNFFYIYLIFHSKVKFIFWGAQEIRSPFFNFFWKSFLKLSSATFVFYSKSKYQPFHNLNSSRFHLINNTIHVKHRIKSYREKNKLFFINVGSLHFRKQNDTLLIVFKKLLTLKNNKLKLYLIGSGEEEFTLKKIISRLNLENNVFIIDETTDSKELQFYYRNSIAAVSFGQAGLAVLQSMAFGVPFITRMNAITGGEKDNIIHKYNGLICKDTKTSLYKSMCLLVDDTNYSRYLGLNAYKYYSKNCSMNNMITKFSQIIDS